MIRNVSVLLNAQVKSALRNSRTIVPKLNYQSLRTKDPKNISFTTTTKSILQQENFIFFIILNLFLQILFKNKIINTSFNPLN